MAACGARIGQARQAESTQWERDHELSSADKEAILTLSNQLGLGTPRGVSSVLIQQPGGCLAELVQSLETVVNQVVSWKEVVAIPASASDRTWCTTPRFNDLDPSTLVPGTVRWQSYSHVRTLEAWRVVDRNWHLDVEFERGIGNRPAATYEATSRIILALRYGTFVDRRGTPDPWDAAMVSQWLAGVINDLKKPQPTTRLRLSLESTDQYQLHADGRGGGLIVSFRLIDNKVELLHTGSWIS
jgi:hypothetical protein